MSKPETTLPVAALEAGEDVLAEALAMWPNVAPKPGVRCGCTECAAIVHGWVERIYRAVQEKLPA